MLKHKRTWKETLVMEAVVDNKQEKMGDQFEWKNQKRMRRSRPAEDSVEAPWVRAIEPQARIAEKKKPQLSWLAISPVNGLSSNERYVVDNKNRFTPYRLILFIVTSAL